VFEVSLGSIPGPYHLKNNLNNQDAVVFHDERDHFVAAIADGAGSLKHSDEGAYAAVNAAVYEAFAHVASGDLGEMTRQGLAAATTTQKRFENYKEYGSTLTVVAMNQKGEWAVSAVGDSFAVVHMNDDSHEFVSGSPVGEYANITELLTSDSIHPIHASGSNAKGFSLSTDGLEHVASVVEKSSPSGRNSHAGFWNGVLVRAEKGQLDVLALFEWLNKQDQITDDTTLLTVVRR